MTGAADTEALIRDLQVARIRFEAGRVPDGIDDLLARLDGAGIDKVTTMAAGVRGLLEEGASRASHAMIATSFSLAEVFLRVHLIEPGKPAQ